MKAERRLDARKAIDQIQVVELTSMSNYRVIAERGIITDASNKGFLLKVDRKSLIPADLRNSLSLEELVGQQVVMFLPQMNLDLDGTVIRADHKGKGLFQIAVSFAAETPEYWRECLVDLLPAPGELTDIE